MASLCSVAGLTDPTKRSKSRPLEGRKIFIDLVDRKNHVAFEKKLQLLGAVRSVTD